MPLAMASCILSPNKVARLTCFGGAASAHEARHGGGWQWS
jgi:hypothetical protein